MPIIIIPLGGTGQRFKQKGYTQPKALIPVKGKPILFYLLDQLDEELTNSAQLDKNNYLIYLPYNQEYLSHGFERIVKENYSGLNLYFYSLPFETRGATETLWVGIKNLLLMRETLPKSFVPLTNRKLYHEPCLCLDGDNFYSEPVLTPWMKDSCPTAVYYFVDQGDSSKFCFLELEPTTNQLTKLVEKERISNLAGTGGYAFSSLGLLFDQSDRLLLEQTTTKGEYYTSLVIQKIIKEGRPVMGIKVDNFTCLGTPEQVDDSNTKSAF